MAVLSHGKHFSLKDCVVFIQMEGFVVIKASFAGAALNHYTCTNLLIYLRAGGGGGGGGGVNRVLTV